MTPADYQNRFGTDARQLRAYLRHRWPERHAPNDPWWLTDEMIADARNHFRESNGSTVTVTTRDLKPVDEVSTKPRSTRNLDSTANLDVRAKFSIDGWRAAGFAGFLPLLALDPSRVPTGGGVYAVLRRGSETPTFTPTSCGGRFKAKDPAVGPDVLAAKWIDGVDTIYIGKATSLRTRLRQFRDFGRGRPVGHWGGRYIWQLADAPELVICWNVTPDEPREVERTLLREFATIHGRRPFANLID